MEKLLASEEWGAGLSVATQGRTAPNPAGASDTCPAVDTERDYATQTGKKPVC